MTPIIILASFALVVSVAMLISPLSRDRSWVTVATIVLVVANIVLEAVGVNDHAFAARVRYEGLVGLSTIATALLAARMYLTDRRSARAPRSAVGD